MRALARSRAALLTLPLAAAALGTAAVPVHAAAAPAADARADAADPAAPLAAAPVAYAELSRRADVVFAEQGEWLVADDAANFTVWSFTRPGHAAHPSVVRRRIVERDGTLGVQMDINCGAAKPACDQLARDAESRNRQLGADGQTRPAAPPAEPR